MIVIRVSITDDTVPPPHNVIEYKLETDRATPFSKHSGLRKLIQQACDGAIDRFFEIGHESWRRGRVLTPAEIDRLLAEPTR